MPRSWAHRDELGLWLTILFWSLNFLAVKIGVQGMSPEVFTGLRFMIAAPLLLLIARAQSGLRVDRKDILPVITGGLLGVTAYQVLFTTAIALTDVASAAILVTLSPVMAATFGWLSRSERLGWPNIAGVLLGFAGAAVVVLSGRPETGSIAPAPLIGDICAVAAALVWAAYGIMSAPLVRRVPPLTATAWQATIGALTLLPMTVLGIGASHFGWGALTVLYSALPVTVFGLSFWQAATGRLGPTKVLVYVNAEPVIAAAAAALVLGQPLRPGTVVGGLVALSGVYLARAGSMSARAGQAETD